MQTNEMIVSSRIPYEDYRALHEIRLAAGTITKRPSISELIRLAIRQYIQGENNEGQTTS